MLTYIQINIFIVDFLKKFFQKETQSACKESIYGLLVTKFFASIFMPNHFIININMQTLNPNVRNLKD